MVIRFTAVNNFSITAHDTTIWNISKDSVILAEPLGAEARAGLSAKLMIIPPDKRGYYSFNADLDRDFQSNTSIVSDSPKSTTYVSETLANRHVQIKVCETEDEANEFLANRPDTDIISVTPTVVDPGHYASVHFNIVYKTDL